jgi:hypothetical protein
MRKLIIRLATCFVVAILSSAVVISCKPDEESEGGSKTVEVTGVSISKTSLSLTEEDTETLTASVTPADATNKTIRWSSSNTSVATVDANGKVTAVGAGTANITAASADGYKTASCSVTVKGLYRALTKIEITPAESNLTFGNTASLSVKYTPENASNKNVTWKSSNTDVAKVSSSGMVEVVNEGTATITATSEDGGHKATAKITVSGTAKPGVYFVVDNTLYRDGNSFYSPISLNPSLDLENRLYYYSYADNNIYISGVPIFNYNLTSLIYETAAGGGYFFVGNINDPRTEISVIKTSPIKKSGKTVSIHKSSTKNDLWLYDMAADTKGNLYVAGKTRRSDGYDIATLWKLDTNDKVTSTSYSNGVGSKSGPAVEAVSVNKNGDVFCLVYEGSNGSYGYQKLNLYKNGKKLYQVTELCSMFSSQCCDLMAVGNDVYMSICESPNGTGITTQIKVYKNQKVIYTIKEGDRLAAGDIFVTSKGDVYCAGHTSSDTKSKYYIWKNGKVFYSSDNVISAHSLAVKE